MEASTSAAAHVAAGTSSGTTKATVAGKLAIWGKLGWLHPGTVSGSGAVAAPGASTTGPGGGAAAVTGHGAGAATAHGGIWTFLGAHMAAKPHVAVLALKTSLLAKSLAVVSIGVVGIVVAAHTGLLPAAQVGVSAVPTWSSGPSLAAHVQAGLGLHGSSSGGLRIGL